MHGLEMSVKRMLTWKPLTTCWTQAFVAFAMVGSFNMLVKGFLVFVGFEAIFKLASELYFGLSTQNLMLIFTFNGGKKTLYTSCTLTSSAGNICQPILYPLGEPLRYGTQ